jgi:pyrimidine deaminase RibD-like protein
MEVDHWSFMRRAVDLGKLSIEEPGRTSRAPRVGVVLARGNDLLGESYRGETGASRHAEFGLFDRLKDADLSGSTLYTTLEPCSRRNHPKVPCARWTIDRGVSTVYIGIYDPNPAIYREGWHMLGDAGVDRWDFPSELRAEIRADNAPFLDQFQRAVGDRGTATFDHLQNGGRFEIVEAAGEMTFSTRWTACGARSIYALDYENNVALARYARQFDEIHDPGALDFGNYTTAVNEGEIVVFRNQAGYALVRVSGVLAGPDAGDDRTELRIEYELRR